MSDVFNPTAERAVIAAALVFPGAFEALSLVPKDFHMAIHQTVWEAMSALRVKDRPLDPISVNDELRMRGDDNWIGFLTTVILEAPVPEMVHWHAALVSRDSAKRRLAAWTLDLSRRIDKSDDVAELVADARQALEAVGAGEGGPSRLGDRINEVISTIEAKREKPWQHAVPTGIKKFDDFVGGMRPGRLVVVAARPGIGKTSLVRSMSLYATVKEGIPTLLFSLEMTFQELAEQFIAAHVRIPAEKVDRGELDDTDYKRIYREHKTLTDAPLYIDDRVLSAPQISSAARAWRARQTSPQVLVAVDYLGLIRSAERTETRALEVGKMGWQMKVLAKDLACPVILVAQLNREVEKRGENAQPKLSDLRDSGEIEQHAHMVVFPHRNAPLDKSGPAELIVAKNRGGKTGLVGCHWNGELMVFGDAAGPEFGDEPRAYRD